MTGALQGWIGTLPNGSTIAFAPDGCYRIDGTVELRGRSGLVFAGNGATFRSSAPMTSGSVADDQRAMWRLIGSSGLRFQDMVVVGSYTRGGTLDTSLQHAHGFDFRGTSVDVSGVSVSGVAGDCFYFGLGYDSTTRSSGSVHDSSCAGAGRNGVAVTAANDLAVTRNRLDRVGLTAVDLEPNVGPSTASTGWGTARVSATSNVIGSYRLYAFAVVENAPSTSSSFVGNTVTGTSGLRIGVVAPGGSVRPSGLTISGNVATTSTWAPAMEIHNVDGLRITGNTVPTSGRMMATLDSSCAVDLSGNVFTGATALASVTNPTC